MSETEGAPQGAPEETSAPESQAPDQGGQHTQTQSEAAPAEPKAEEKPPEKKEPPWFMKQINQQHARLQAQERELEELRELRRLIDAANQQPPEQNTAQPNQASRPPQQHGPISQAEIDRLVQQRAVELKQAEEFNNACNQTYTHGKQAYADFDDAVQHLSMLSGGAPKREFLEAVTALPNSHEVYYHLGKNLDEAARVFSLPPVKMAVELARLSANATPKPKAASRAPAPIAPVAGASRGSDDDDDLYNPKLSWQKFNELREAQEKAYRGRR